jgi:hypothetical protein
MKLSKEPTSRKEWSAAYRVNDRLNEGTRLTNLENNQVKGKQHVESKKNTPKETIEKLMDQELYGVSPSYEYAQFVTYIKRMKYAFSNRDFREVDIRFKKELSKLSEDLSDEINRDYFNSLE